MTTFHGVPWSVKVNSPRWARTYCRVVVQALRSCGGSPLSRGKLCRPSGNVSTYMRQSVISIASNTTRWSTSVLHGMDTVMRCAVRKGRESGVRPSMTRSSSTKRPRNRCTDMRPMCIGRRRYCVAAASARALTAGPRSTVTVVTSVAARMTAQTMTTRRMTVCVFCVTGWRKSFFKMRNAKKAGCNLSCCQSCLWNFITPPRSTPRLPRPGLLRRRGPRSPSRLSASAARSPSSSPRR